MRLQLIATQQSSPLNINLSLFSLLQEEVAKRGEIVLTDDAPDLVHVFGAWDNNTAAVVSYHCKRKTPMVLTALQGLQAMAVKGCGDNVINTKRLKKEILRKVQAVHVCGEKEAEAVGKCNPNVKRWQIYNPFFTSTTTEEKVVNAILKMYEETYTTYEQTVRSEIKSMVESAECADANVNIVCQKILYIKYIMLRGGITQAMLADLSSTMTTLQYDEDVMSAMATKLKIKPFASSLFAVLERKASLTEGFMPFPATENNTTNLIERNILNQ